MNTGPGWSSSPNNSGIKPIEYYGAPPFSPMVPPPRLPSKLVAPMEPCPSSATKPASYFQPLHHDVTSGFAVAAATDTAPQALPGVDVFSRMVAQAGRERMNAGLNAETGGNYAMLSTGVRVWQQQQAQGGEKGRVVLLDLDLNLDLQPAETQLPPRQQMQSLAHRQYPVHQQILGGSTGGATPSAAAPALKHFEVLRAQGAMNPSEFGALTGNGGRSPLEPFTPFPDSTRGASDPSGLIRFHGASSPQF
ncbi:hypothetical protein FVE85_6178 [Porphyridium purpureum]|uniref:Uncharacterized protein n=1 Tax=Porphyridium purpureum TaxID=35688 RepID=A0A5J4Z6W0_PORPP|nr:hypothetical protein FVE85_6178 [Porphyridium purpureum]|eukprot:POR3491..scf295_1